MIMQIFRRNSNHRALRCVIFIITFAMTIISAIVVIIVVVVVLAENGSGSVASCACNKNTQFHGLQPASHLNASCQLLFFFSLFASSCCRNRLLLLVASVSCCIYFCNDGSVRQDSNRRRQKEPQLEEFSAKQTRFQVYSNFGRFQANHHIT